MKNYGTLEDKRVLLDSILESMIDGNGLSMTKACRKHGVCPSTFIDWVETDQLQDTTIPERYKRAQKISCLLEADAISDDLCNKFDNPMTNEFGIDKGFVEMEKVRAGTRQWRLNGRTRMFLDKQEDVESEGKTSTSVQIIFEEAKPNEAQC